jgi:hypothetical protein
MAFEVLLNAVYRNDADGFLREYLELMLDRKSLTVPTGEKLGVVKIQWQACLPIEFDRVPDLFLRNLSQRWLEIVEKLGRNFYEDYANDALKVVKNQIVYNKKLKEIVRVGNHSVTIGGDPKLKHVVSTLSDAYYKELREKEDKEQQENDDSSEV